MSTNIYNYLQMSANIYKCLQISTNIHKYLQMSTNIYKYLQISSNICKYLQYRSPRHVGAEDERHERADESLERRLPTLLFVRPPPTKRILFFLFFVPLLWTEALRPPFFFSTGPAAHLQSLDARRVLRPATREREAITNTPITNMPITNMP